MPLDTVTSAPTDDDIAPTPATPPAPAERSTRQAVMRGMRRRCPSCGQGPLFDGYLKVTDTCPVCNESLHLHRADDGPAYLTILIVGHAMAPLIHVLFTRLRPDPLIFATMLTIAAVAMSLFLLPRMKGLIVGVQWSKRMHGFGAAS